MRKKQFGLTFFGVVFIGGGIVFSAILGMKMVPAYIDHFTVKKILTAMAKDSAFAAMTPADVRKSFDRRAQIDYQKAVEGKDLDIAKTPNGNVASVNYTVVVPIVGNVSVMMEFEASTAGTKADKVIG